MPKVDLRKVEFKPPTLTWHEPHCAEKACKAHKYNACGGILHRVFAPVMWHK